MKNYRKYLWNEGKILARKFDSVLKYLNISFERDCQRFNMNLDQLEHLIKENVINIHDYQNGSPSIRQFRNISKYFSNVEFSCYIVDKDRNDCRISIDGLTLYIDENNVKQRNLLRQLLKFYPNEVLYDIDGKPNTRWFWWD